MAESEVERAKRELREAVRRAVEGVEAPNSGNPAVRDAEARDGAEMAGGTAKGS